MTKSDEYQFQRGEQVRDKVTGLKGIIVSRGDHISGCNTYGIQPAELKDGLPLDVKWFDEPRLVSLGPSVLSVDDRERRTGADSTPPAQTRSAVR